MPKRVPQLVLLSITLIGYPIAAQSSLDFSNRSPFEQDLLSATEATLRKLPPPIPLAFAGSTRIALPGPLPPGSPRLVGERIELPVEGGLARTDWRGATGPEVVPLQEVGADDAQIDFDWAVGPHGKYRFRALAAGWILAEKRCRACSSTGWRRRWKLRVTGSTLARPLVTDRRLYFGALDNRV